MVYISKYFSGEIVRKCDIVIKVENSIIYKSSIEINREIGENPIRSRQCDQGFVFKPLNILFGKGIQTMLFSQETCFYNEKLNLRCIGVF